MDAYRPYPDDKDSGIEWLGQIPVHWGLRRLKFVASITYSNVDKHVKEDEVAVRQCNYVDVYKNEHIVNDLKFMEVTAKPEEIRRFLLRPGDIILTKDSEDWKDIAVPAFVPEPLESVICGYHLALVRPSSPDVDANYLFRSFQATAINYQFQVEASGITRYGLGKRALGDALVLLPPLPDQRAIAAFLDRETARIDALIAKKRELIDLLQRQRVAVISHAVTKGLDPSSPLKDSGIEWLGEIPAHWDVERNKWLFREVNERLPEGQEDELLTVSHITGVTRRAEKEVYMFLAETLVGYKVCHPGDLVINTMWAWMGALGVSFLKGVASPSYNVYRPGPRVFPRYYDYLCRSPQHVFEINRWSKGVWSSRLRLYPKEFFSIRTPLPPLEEQRAIAAFLDRETARIDRLVAEIEASIDLLQRQRTALISAAVTGKIDVRDMDDDWVVETLHATSPRPQPAPSGKKT